MADRKTDNYEKRLNNFMEHEEIRIITAGPAYCPVCKTKLGCNRGCPKCKLSYDEARESYFSWRECEACNTTLGGDRHIMSAVLKDGMILEYEVCTRCMVYLEFS